MRPIPTKKLKLRHVPLTAAVGILAAIESTAQEVQAASPPSFDAAYVLMLLGCISLFLAWCAGALRWKWILDASGLRFKYGFLLQTWIAADFLSRLIPLVYAAPPLGAAYRLAQTARVSRETVRSAAAIGIEKLYGLVSLALLFLVLMPVAVLHLDFSFARFRFLILVLAFFVLASIALAVLLQPRLLWLLAAQLSSSSKTYPKLTNLLASLSIFEGKRLKSVQIVALGVIMHALSFLYLGSFICAVTVSGVSWLSGLMTSVLDLFGPITGWLLMHTPSATAIARGALADLDLSVESAQLQGAVPLFAVSMTFLFIQLSRIALRKPESLDIAQPRGEEQARRVTPEDARDFRRYIASRSAAAFGGGLIAGAAVGLTEALWLTHLLTIAEELRLLWWGPLFYGIFLSPFGLGVGLLVAFLAAPSDKRPRAPSIAILSLAATLTICIVVFGRFRYARDVLGEGAMSTGEVAAFMGIAVGVGLLVIVAGIRLLRNASFGWKRGALTVCAGYGALVVTGGGLGTLWADPYGPGEDPPLPGLRAPNVIFIVADTLRADYLRMYSPEAQAETPHLETFRRDAILFEEFFAQAPWTKPAFGSMFTGLYPTEHGLIGKASRLIQGVEMLPERLLNAGYYTQGFPNNANIIRAYGFGKGFVDYEFLTRNNLLFSTTSVTHLELYQVLRRLHGRLQLPRIDIDSFYQPAPVVNDTVKEWIERESPGENPFFLFFHYMDPHEPYMSADTPPRGYAMVHLGLQPDFDEYAGPMREAYIDEIERLDRYYGEIMDFLKSKDLYEDALIIFVSDHGEEFYDHEGWWHALTHYDEMVHVPLLIKLPGNRMGGGTNADYGRQIDIAPTILEVLGLPPSKRMSGQPLINANGDFLNRDISRVYAESNILGAKIHSARDPEMKFIRSVSGPHKALVPLELFHLQRDPGEQNNLAGRGEAKEVELRAWLEGMMKELKPGGPR